MVRRVLSVGVPVRRFLCLQTVPERGGAVRWTASFGVHPGFKKCVEIWASMYTITKRHATAKTHPEISR